MFCSLKMLFGENTPFPTQKKNRFLLASTIFPTKNRCTAYIHVINIFDGFLTSFDVSIRHRFDSLTETMFGFIYVFLLPLIFFYMKFYTQLSFLNRSEERIDWLSAYIKCSCICKINWKWLQANFLCSNVTNFLFLSLNHKLSKCMP